MKIEDFFNQPNIVDLSFFNFRNAITAAYFANDKLEVQKVNENFESFFPILGNVTNIYFPHVLEQLGVPGAQIEEFVENIAHKGFILIPEVHIPSRGRTGYFPCSLRAPTTTRFPTSTVYRASSWTARQSGI